MRSHAKRLWVTFVLALGIGMGLAPSEADARWTVVCWSRCSAWWGDMICCSDADGGGGWCAPTGHPCGG